jgi:valyl-tRNA synthetase
MKFGTGAVKVTPAHDFNDFATGKRHKLPEINILNKDGTLNEECGPFTGLDRKRARTAVKKALDEKGLARGAKPHTLTLPRCQRTGGVVEPMISTQWFLKMDQMAARAMEAVKTGEVEIIPAEWVKTYDHFLSNIQDWCVSRQLWWGHQIPAWHGPNGEIRVARTRPAECGEGWTQDPDVLDTWFSSALWPFATQGWPESTPALAKFYPASDLETGYDILFFWVARMIMFGTHFMGQVPFKRVLLSGLIVDETGDKMSKVKGNVIDPLDLIYGAEFTDVVKKTMPGAPEAEALAKFKKAYPSAATMGQSFPAFGADALRFTLSTFPPSNKRIALAPKRLEGYRHFINKVWNASRLVFELTQGVSYDTPVTKPKGFFNRWILSRLAETITAASAGIGGFRVDETANEIYRFFWNDFCDWYLEITKPLLRQPVADGAQPSELLVETRLVILHVLETSFRLMHPLMPFVTEELWQRMPKPTGRKASIAFGPYPSDADASVDTEVQERMTLLQAVISAGRTIRSEHEVHPAALAPLSLRGNADAVALLREHEDTIRLLVKTEGAITFDAPGAPRGAGSTASIVPSRQGPIEVLLGLKGLVTRDKELTRIERELKNIDKDLQAIDKKLGSKGFVDRAPKEVVEETHAQRKSLTEARERLGEARKLADEL